MRLVSMNFSNKSTQVQKNNLCSQLNGLLLIDKPAGPTSFGIIEQLQKALRAHTGLKRSDLPKMGHAGTLDPFATGLLIVGIGEGAKLCRYLQESQKTYSAKMVFGKTTKSGDLSDLINDPIILENDRIPKSLEQLQTLADEFSKKPYVQTPPMHSAKKVQGTPLYKLARQGIEIERAPVICTVSNFYFSDFSPPTAQFSVQVSAGTFIRTLAQDFAQKLETTAALLELRRTKSSSLSVENAVQLKDLENTSDWTTLRGWIDFDNGLNGLESVHKTEISELEAQKLIHGQQSILQDIAVARPQVFQPSTKRVALLNKSKLIGIATKCENEPWSIERIFSINTLI